MRGGTKIWKQSNDGFFSHLCIQIQKNIPSSKRKWVSNGSICSYKSFGKQLMSRFQVY